MSETDGGPAFPVVSTPASQPGMSLRDYFAAESLVLFADSVTLTAIRESAKASQLEVPVMVARYAYELADAMLKERAK